MKSVTTKKLSRTKTKASSLIGGESPIIIVDPKKAARNAAKLKKTMPRVDFYYAVKSFNDAKIISELSSAVTGYDVASLGEIEELVALGIDTKRMIYSNPVKVPAHIKGAAELGVSYFAFDSTEEVSKLSKNAPGSNVYLRILVPDQDSKFPLSSKFGVDPVYAVAYASTAIEKGLKFRGIAFHVGSQCQTAVAWQNAIQLAANTIRNLHTAGIAVDILNIGGGFPAKYHNGNIVGLKDIAKTVNQALDEHIPKKISVIAEPGRYISADTATIYSTVIGREHRPDGAEWLYIDVGAFQGLIEPLEVPSLRYPVTNLSRSIVKAKNFVLTGPTCDADDTLGTDYILPHDTATGDVLAIESAGAYSMVYASHFNGFAPPKIRYISK